MNSGAFRSGVGDLRRGARRAPGRTSTARSVLGSRRRRRAYCGFCRRRLRATDARKSSGSTSRTTAARFVRDAAVLRGALSISGAISSAGAARARRPYTPECRRRAAVEIWAALRLPRIARIGGADRAQLPSRRRFAERLGGAGVRPSRTTSVEPGRVSFGDETNRDVPRASLPTARAGGADRLARSSGDARQRKSSAPPTRTIERSIDAILAAAELPAAT